MKKVILLATSWKDYWDSDKEASYHKLKYHELHGWEDLSQTCPIAGLGIYLKDFKRIPFVYLKITGMRYDLSETPFFDFKVIQKSKTESQLLCEKLPPQSKKLFSVIDGEQIIKILEEVGEEPPPEWHALLELNHLPTISWHDYIGKYFLEIESESISNNEFEDRIAALLTALGFKVIQKGHKIPGEYPDGVAVFEDKFAIVYDCKNKSNYIPTSGDKRALNKYLSDEKYVREALPLFPVFIAKSFNVPQEKLFHFTVESLLYLLYKKIVMGDQFNLLPLKKILLNQEELSKEVIDKEWVGGVFSYFT
jgi:hypothetical protein